MAYDNAFEMGRHIMTTAMKPTTCAHCGGYHTTTCPRIRAIEYHQDGTVKRVEFHTFHAGDSLKVGGSLK